MALVPWRSSACRPLMQAVDNISKLKKESYFQNSLSHQFQAQEDKMSTCLTPFVGERSSFIHIFVFQYGSDIVFKSRNRTTEQRKHFQIKTLSDCFVNEA
ncbi:hypothetical protein KIN20_018693 [Parelaphostrongylus tenuis]|uniref:Uncharacterized protein n=1 Tax=Parelaphostrongylus tenuis TaxID=148309 RepID=A0AAD5QSA8_PARTN|nr:hypothetical protein KIN20_018693 [Parelaphostrongylus tenuis]